MTPLMHPELVNDPFGDPCVFVDFRFQKRAILLDMGELDNLPVRKIVRLTHAFVSHAHMDHFCGFDRVVKTLVGRPKTLWVFGPAGIVDKVEHKLAAYTWNLVDDTSVEFIVQACEFHRDGRLCTARFRITNAFEREDLPARQTTEGVIVDEPGYRVRAVHLDHRIPCLGFAIEEKQHFNIWRNRVTAMGLGIGPWLDDLKQAIRQDDPDDLEITARWRKDGRLHEVIHRLADVRQLVEVTPGQKIAYVTDVGYTPDNVGKIIALAKDSDLLLIESAFLQADAEIAAQKMHLTAHQAGTIARLANVRRLEQFHFSSRYEGQVSKLYQEASAARAGHDPSD